MHVACFQVISTGGDGTLLHMSSMFPRHNPPSISFFNFGAEDRRDLVGFLSPHSLHSLGTIFSRIFNNQGYLLKRQRLEFCVAEDSHPEEKLEWRHLLNELVLKRSHRYFHQ